VKTVFHASRGQPARDLRRPVSRRLVIGGVHEAYWVRSAEYVFFGIVLVILMADERVRAGNICGATAIFLDRDGTLNRKAPEGEYIRRSQELELFPGAATAVRRANISGILTVLITNQRWLSEPAADMEAYYAVQARLHHLLAVHDAWLDACYVCPHQMNSCGCRKPRPGMLLNAARDLVINLHSSFVIGDSVSDIQAGLAVGAKTVLIDPARNSFHHSRAHFIANNIDDAVNWALDEVEKSALAGERLGRREP